MLKAGRVGVASKEVDPFGNIIGGGGSGGGYTKEEADAKFQTKESIKTYAVDGASTVQISGGSWSEITDVKLALPKGKYVISASVPLKLSANGTYTARLKNKTDIRNSVYCSNTANVYNACLTGIIELSEDTNISIEIYADSANVAIPNNKIIITALSV